MQTTTTFRTVYEIYAPSLPINESRRITHEWGSQPPTQKEEKVKMAEIAKGLGGHDKVRVFLASHPVVYRIPEPPELLDGQPGQEEI